MTVSSVEKPYSKKGTFSSTCLRTHQSVKSLDFEVVLYTIRMLLRFQM